MILFLADFRLKTPDAIQAACCLSLSCSHIFLTQDGGFDKVDSLSVMKVLSDGLP